MFRRVLTCCLFSFVGFGIFLFSVLQVATSPRYAFGLSSTPTPAPTQEEIKIPYTLPFPGTVLPNHFLWPVKAFRDRVWLTITVNPVKRAEVLILLADKRLISAKRMFEAGEPELGVTTLTKAEKYLEQAFEKAEEAKAKGTETGELYEKLTLASLMHRKVMEEILLIAPEDAKPAISEAIKYPNDFYQKGRDGLLEAGKSVPENPFGTR